MTTDCDIDAQLHGAGKSKASMRAANKALSVPSPENHLRWQTQLLVWLVTTAASSAALTH